MGLVSKMCVCDVKLGLMFLTSSSCDFSFAECRGSSCVSPPPIDSHWTHAHCLAETNKISTSGQKYSQFLQEALGGAEWWAHAHRLTSMFVNVCWNVVSHYQMLIKRRHKRLKLLSTVSRYVVSSCLTLLKCSVHFQFLISIVINYPLTYVIGEFGSNYMYTPTRCICARHYHMCNSPVQGILQYVNKQLNRAENRQRLMEHQSKLDTSALERTTHPIAQQFKVR